MKFNFVRAIEPSYVVENKRCTKQEVLVTQGYDRDGNGTQGADSCKWWRKENVRKIRGEKGVQRPCNSMLIGYGCEDAPANQKTPMQLPLDDGWKPKPASGYVASWANFKVERVAGSGDYAERKNSSLIGP